MKGELSQFRDFLNGIQPKYWALFLTIHAGRSLYFAKIAMAVGSNGICDAAYVRMLNVPLSFYAQRMGHGEGHSFGIYSIIFFEVL